MVRPSEKIVRVAAVQAAPVLFDKDSSIQKALDLIQNAGNEGAQIIVFPEAFIPAYPRGFSFGCVVGSRKSEGRELFRRYFENSVEVPGRDTAKLGRAAKHAKAYVVVGVTERDGFSLYCTVLYFSPQGELIGKHRKLKPTASERLIWGEGDGSTLTVVDTKFGKLGGLICWENLMPLARMVLYSKGIEIYVAPTADARDAWQATMRHIAQEGRCYVLGCNQYVTKSMYPNDLETLGEIADEPEIMCRGGSVIVAPSGDVIAGPLWDREGTLYATLDLNLIPKYKLDFDVMGHYAKPEVFSLSVNVEPRKTVAMVSSEATPRIRRPRTGRAEPVPEPVPAELLNLLPPPPEHASPPGEESM